MVTDARAIPSAADPQAATVDDAQRARLLRLALGVRCTRFWQDALRRRLLAVADLGAVVVAAAAAGTWGDDRSAAWSVLLFTPGWLVIAKVCGLYDRDHRTLRHLTTDEIPRLVIWALAGTTLMTMVELPFHGIRVLSEGERLVLRLVLLFSALTLRSAARAFWRGAVPPERAVIVGDGALARAARRKLELFPDMHLEVIRESSSADLGSSEFARFVEGADRVVLAAESIDEVMLADLIRASREHRLKVSVVPPMRSAIGTAVELSRVADLPLVEYYTWDASRTTLAAKRALDVLAAGIALLALSPLIALLAVLVRLTSPGPAFFVQERAGLRGRPFTMLKLRTMVADAHAQRGQLDPLLLDPLALKLRDDPRVTPIGRFLRRTSLDELPQLLNVLRGEMSLVGPRPEEVDVVARYLPEHTFRLTMKPGLTGPMQVYGRGNLGLEERLAVERDYVENISLGRDLRLLGLTLGSVFRRNGAY